MPATAGAASRPFCHPLPGRGGPRQNRPALQESLQVGCQVARRLVSLWRGSFSNTSSKLSPQSRGTWAEAGWRNRLLRTQQFQRVQRRLAAKRSTTGKSSRRDSPERVDVRPRGRSALYCHSLARAHVAWRTQDDASVCEPLRPPAPVLFVGREKAALPAEVRDFRQTVRVKSTLAASNRGG